MTTHAQYVRKNTMISIVISMVISAVFFWLVFGGAPLIPVFGGTSLTVDFIPQTLAAGFMAAFVPAMQTRAKIKAGQFAGATPAIGGIVLRAIALAVAALVLAAVVTGALWIGGSDELSWSAAFIVKVIYGGLLGLIITPIALRALLPKG